MSGPGIQRAREALFCVGWLALLAGIAAYDWRIALIVGGAALAGLAWKGMMR